MSFDWVDRAKEAAQKVVTSPLTKREFKIRKLTSSELLEAGINPLISSERKLEKQEDPILAQATALAWLASNSDKITIAQTRHVLTNGVVEPKLVYGDESVVETSAVHVRWISEDEDWLYLTVLEFSGHASSDHKKRLEELLKNGNGSAESTPSQESMANSPAK